MQAIPNIGEWALGTHPLEESATPLSIAPGGNRHYRITYEIREDLPFHSVTIGFSEDLDSWRVADGLSALDAPVQVGEGILRITRTHTHAPGEKTGHFRINISVTP